MNAYGNILLIAMPGFLVLIIIEMVWGRWKHKEHQPVIDTVSSLTSGMTNILKSTLGLTIVIVSYTFLEQHLHLMEWGKESFWPYIIVFVFFDFSGYWAHRLQHRVNFFWSHHLVHHSSEEFNLPCALRQQIAVMTNVYTLMLVPMALIGISPGVLALVGPIHLFSQFWYHTRYIGKLGFLEYIIVTPSQHRVHHAMNDIYMDKNYSQIFIVWDRMFGTFQEELSSEPCVYGMRRPAQTWNPYIINFKHWYTLAVDAWHTKNMGDKFRIWFMPTGWRPADVMEKYPLFTVEKMSDLKKHNPIYSNWFQAFSVLHITVVFLLLSFLFFRFGEISQAEALINGIILMLAIFGFTALLDKKKYGVVSMVMIGAGIVCFTVVSGDWFGLNDFLPMGSAVVVAYFAITALAAVWFYKTELNIAVEKNVEVFVSAKTQTQN